MAGVRPITDIFLPYVLEMPGEVEEDGMSLAMVLCVVRKESGVLLAAPSNFFLAEVLEAGQIAGPDDLVGPSVLMHVPGGRLDQMNGSPPVAAPDAWVDVMVVDMSPDILDQLTPVAEYDGPTELLHLFDTDPFVYPLRDDLVSMTWDWLVQPSSVERIQYYSAGEEEQEEEELVPETVAAAPLPHAVPAGPKAAGLPIGAGKGQKPRSPPKAKKPSVASLATSFESVMAVLPALTNQIAELNQRTKTMEERMQEPGRLSALSRPLGDSAMTGSSAKSPPTAATLLKEMPPPSNLLKLKQPSKGGGHVETETAALVEEKNGESGGGDMIQAMFAQSTAITALAAQIASMSGDPMGELASSSTGFSSKGAAGRMKLQLELAAQKGTFFSAVVANMGRRMHPAMRLEATPMQLAGQGITMSKYVERFGGYGRARDFGHVMWQVALIMDHLQMENWQGAMDATALLAVCLEQTALDGSMDVGLLLSLSEDPPSGVFTNRSLAPLSRGKAFAPLASQQWIAVALSYIKELDLITQKRADLTGGKTQPAGDLVAPKVKPKPQPKWKKKKKGLEDAEEG